MNYKKETIFTNEPPPKVKPNNLTIRRSVHKYSFFLDFYLSIFYSLNFSPICKNSFWFL